MSTDDQTPSESTRTIGVTSLLPGRTGALRFMVPDALPEPSPSLANRRRLVIFVRHDGILAGRLGLAGGQLTAEWLVEERIAPPPATTGLDFGDLSTGSELPAVALMQSAIERLVANLPRHEGKAVLVLGGRFVRHSIETVPKTSKRVTQLALRRLFRVQPHEQISWQTLATSMNRGEPAITHQVFATDRALVLGILSSLQQANIAVTRTLPETALDAVCAVNYERFTTEGGAILIAMLTENRLCQTFVDQGRVLFVRRSAIHMDDRVDQRVAGEIQRTSVFFHRRFREYSVDRIQLMVTGTVDGPRFATAIAEKVAHELSWCKLHLERPADLSDAVNDSDFLTMATTVFSDQEPQIAQWDLTPVEWRQRRGLTLALPLLVFIVAMCLAGVMWVGARVHQTRDTRRDELAMLDRRLRPATGAINRWNSMRARTNEILGRHQRLARHFSLAPHHSELVLQLVQSMPRDSRLRGFKLVPPGARLRSAVDRELAAELEARGRLAAQSARIDENAWRLSLSAATPLDYFESEAVIGRFEHLIRSLPGHVAGSLQVRVDPNYLPYRPAELNRTTPDDDLQLGQKHDGCRFTIQSEILGS